MKKILYVGMDVHKESIPESTTSLFAAALHDTPGDVDYMKAYMF